MSTDTPGSAVHAQEAGSLDWTAILDRVPFGAFEPVDPDRSIAFPADHGAHAESPADVWNLAAHLRTGDGQAVGLQMSVARVAIVPPDEPPAESAWEIHAFWLGYATLVQGEASAAIGEERVRRGFQGIAAYDSERREVRLDNWSLRFSEGAGAQPLHIVASIGAAVTVSIAIVPEKPAVTPTPETARPPFMGYAMPRLRAEGTLTTEYGAEAVSGVAWFEHLWGDLPFPGGPTATDRLVLHVDDGTELLVTRTRRRNGAGTPSVDGLVVRPDGSVDPLPEDMTMTADGNWSPPSGDAEYPVRWTLMQGDMELKITPVVDAQFHRFMAPVWSGMVVAEGTSASGPVSAVGTLQLQGYGEE